MLLTTVYLWGLIIRLARQYLRLGPDSIVVVAYAIDKDRFCYMAR
jgi:hypothetical protein